jgi:FAD:protein FMN transferase
LRIASNSVRRARPLLGTFVEVAVAGAPRPAMNAAVEAAFGAVAQVHKLMSFHEAQSDVRRLNAQAWKDPVCVHGWTYRVLQAAIDLHRRSAGVFDIAVAPALVRIGVLPAVGDEEEADCANPATTHAIELLPARHIHFKNRNTRIDLGGIAKGFAVDCALEALRRHGMPMGLVNAGGDLAAFGQGPWRADIRDPRDPGRLICTMELSDAAIASSGGRFDPFRSSRPPGPAIIDPRTGGPPTRIRGATVRAPALTKVVMINGASAVDLLTQYGADALVLLADGEIRMTRDFESAVRHAA